MTEILTLNKIAKCGTDRFDPAKYSCTDSANDPAAVMVRSASMHEMQFSEGLLAIARAGAGVNNIPIDRCSEQGIAVFNTPGANANAVKELVICAALLSSRKITDAIDWCKTLKGEGENVGKLVEKGKSSFTGPEIMGKTMGIVGMGAIGKLVAEAARDLGMRVVCFDRKGESEIRDVEAVGDIDAVFSASDYLSLHIPCNDYTRNIINSESIGKMKDGVRILNFARGELVNSDDILAALACGKVAAYATDFPTDEQLGVPGVIAIPHLGASTPESEDNCVRMVSRQVDDYLRWGSIVHSVNYPDCPLGRCTEPRIAMLHKNVPNVIGSVTQLIAGEGHNIDNMINKSRGAYAYTVVELDKEPSQALMDKLAALDTTYRVRLILP